MGVFLKNGNWFIDYRFNGRRIREKVGSAKSLAELVLKKRKVEIAEGKFLDKKKEQKVKFEEFVDEYLEIHSKVNNRSWKNFDRSNSEHLKRFFGERYLSEITPKMVEELKAFMVQRVSPASTNRVLALLKAIFNKAEAWGKFVGKNPVKGIKFFKEQSRLRFLEKEEIARLIENCDVSIRSIVILAINTGMRRGEILNLKWADVDFKRELLHLYQTKNGDKREVPLNIKAKEALMTMPQRGDSAYVFPSRDGNPFEDIRKSFFTACKKSGIINFRFHDLRHTFASQLVMSGVDLNTVRELLGHKSLEMTLRYAHLSPDHRKRAVDVLNEQLDTFWTPEKKLTTEPNGAVVVNTAKTSS